MVDFLQPFAKQVFYWVPDMSHKKRPVFSHMTGQEEALFIAEDFTTLVSSSHTYALKLTQARGIWIEVRSQYHSLIYASAFL